MSPPRIEGVTDAEPHPAMLLWPSFKQMAEEAAALGPEHEGEEEEHDSCSSCASDDDFEFAPVSQDSGEGFAQGDIVFPVFNPSSLFHESEGQQTPGPKSELTASEDSGKDESDHCLWRPKPKSDPEPEPPALEAAGKSMSTGRVPARSCPSSPCRGELAAGRCRSDGAGKFSFLAFPAPAPKTPVVDRPPTENKKKKKVTEMDMATAHRLFYSNQDGGAKGSQGRRSYLPYRKDLVGFFAGGSRFLPF